MSVVTTFLNLIKPAPLENFSRSTYNNNLDIIDAKMPYVKGQKPFGHMGRTAGFQSMTAGGTVVVMDAAQDLAGGVTFDNSSDSLVLPTTGRYRITVKGMATGGAGIFAGVKAQCNLVDISGAYASTYKQDSNDYHFSHTVTKRFNAGDKINLINMSSVSTWGTDGYNGTYLEVEWVDS